MQRLCNLLFMFVLCAVLIASFSYQFIQDELPCSLCLLQRLAMVAILASLSLNLKFGIKTEHYGLALLSACFGAFVALRQMALHACLPNSFGSPVFGLHLYIWSFLVFASSIFALAILLLFEDYSDKGPRWSALPKTAVGLSALLTLANILTLFFDN